MKTLFLAAAGLLIGTAANAQVASNFSPPLSTDNFAARTQRDLILQTDRVQASQDRLRYVLDESAGRTARPGRLVAMANAGRCTQAIGQARLQGDRVMVRELTRICAL